MPPPLRQPAPIALISPYVSFRHEDFIAYFIRASHATP
jgi:hypothetical protein